MGARVIAVASSPEKLAVTREHGADEAVELWQPTISRRACAS